MYIINLKQVQQLQWLQNTASDEKLEREFQSLIQSYRITIRLTEGCGERAKDFIDNEWRNLVAFATALPEFKSKIPSSKRFIQ